MEILVRVHDTAHGCGFKTEQGSQLTISAHGDVTTDGFLDIAILQQIDPDPQTSSIRLKDQSVWLYLSHSEYVGGIRLMSIPDHLVDQATAAMATSQRRLAKRVHA